VGAGHRVVRQVTSIGNATAVDVLGPIAFVGAGNQVIIVDLPTGTIIARLFAGGYPFGGDVLQDVRVLGEVVYALTLNELTGFDTNTGAQLGVVGLPGSAAGTRRRLFVGGAFAGYERIGYVSSVEGVTTVDLKHAALPTIISGPDCFQPTLHVAPNGSSRLLTCAAFGDPRLQLYDARDPQNTFRYQWHDPRHRWKNIRRTKHKSSHSEVYFRWSIRRLHHESGF